MGQHGVCFCSTWGEYFLFETQHGGGVLLNMVKKIKVALDPGLHDPGEYGAQKCVKRAGRNKQGRALPKDSPLAPTKKLKTYSQLNLT